MNDTEPRSANNGNNEEISTNEQQDQAYEYEEIDNGVVENAEGDSNQMASNELVEIEDSNQIGLKIDGNEENLEQIEDEQNADRLSLHMPRNSVNSISPSEYYQVEPKFTVTRDMFKKLLLDKASRGFLTETPEDDSITPMHQLKNTPATPESSPLKTYLKQRNTKNLMQKLNINLDDSQVERISSIKVIYNTNQNLINASLRHSHNESKYRNRLVDRRFALQRTQKSSNGIMSINTPVDKTEVVSQPSFIFANERVLNEDTQPDAVRLRPVRSGLTSSSKRAASDINTTNRTYNREKTRGDKRSEISSDSASNIARFSSYAVIGGRMKTASFEKKPSTSDLKKKANEVTFTESKSKLSPQSKKQDYRNYKKSSSPAEQTIESLFGTGKIYNAWYQSKTRTESDLINKHMVRSVNIAKVVSNDSTSSLNYEPIEYHGLSAHRPHRLIQEWNPNTFGFDKQNKIKISLKSRHNGTQLWPTVEKTPGPGAHDHSKFTSINPCKPKFTVPHTPRIYPQYETGPFCVF